LLFLLLLLLLLANRGDRSVIEVVIVSVFDIFVTKVDGLPLDVVWAGGDLSFAVIPNIFSGTFCC
jgi:hypothetical protein